MMQMRWMAAIGAALLAAAGPAVGHVTVWPRESRASAHEKYEVRVPNEKQSDTIGIEVRFPPGLRVRSLEQKAGWVTEPILDGSGAVVGVRWSGRLAPRQFTEFGLLAVNPPSSGELVWSAVQSYADGTRIEWTGSPASKTPAPRVVLRD